MGNIKIRAVSDGTAKPVPSVSTHMKCNNPFTWTKAGATMDP